MDKLLYGYNSEERIVAVQQLNDQTIRLYKRNEGKVLHQDVEFFPFFFLSDEALLKDFPKNFWLKELAGGNFYRYIAAFSRWSEMWEAVHFMLHQYNKNHSPRISSYQEFKEILVRPDAVRQYLLQSGITLFKGMKFEELVRLHIDLQFIPSNVKKLKRKGAEETILVITLAASDGTEYTFSTHRNDERTILESCIQRINVIDPDVIEGFDLFGTILPALSRACERLHIPLAIGRDGSDMRTPAGFAAASAGESEWFSYDVFGRHLVDLLTLAESEIDAKRTEHSFTLTSLAKYFGIPVGTDKFIPAQQILEEWNHRPKNIVLQSLHSLRIARDLYNRLSPPLFYLAQMCPFTYRMLTQFSASSRIESLMLREYVRQRHSVPRANENSRSMTLPSEVFYTGVFSDIMYVELAGIHSSILLRQNIKPKTDERDIFLPLLTHLSGLYRDIPGTKDSEKPLSQDSVHQMKAWKRLMDSFHLYLGSARGLFNDPDQADVVLTSSREILNVILHQIEVFNASVVQSDSDGFFLLSPNNIVGESNKKNYIERLSNTLPEGTALILSHHYKEMFSYRKNNYALLDQNNNVFIKGNSLFSRGMERFLKVFIQRVIDCLLTNDLKRMHHTYATAHTQVLHHQWTPRDFCRTDIVRTDTETYQKEVLSGQITASPAMEAVVRSSVFVKANSKVSYYFTGSDAGITLTRCSRLADEWIPHQPDENSAYYFARLHEAIGKFRDFFEPAAFEKIFTVDEMFDFSGEDIHVLTRRVVPESAETKPETEEYSIWLADDE
jgi:DNA polymerase elongation subunit (family B)